MFKDWSDPRAQQQLTSHPSFQRLREIKALRRSMTEEQRRAFMSLPGSQERKIAAQCAWEAADRAGIQWIARAYAIIAGGKARGAWAHESAARRAGLALATRHLIGRLGFEQCHYDELVSAWAELIGPVHPED